MDARNGCANTFADKPFFVHGQQQPTCSAEPLYDPLPLISSLICVGFVTCELQA
jgi:hypothetical protein